MHPVTDSHTPNCFRIGNPFPLALTALASGWLICGPIQSAQAVLGPAAVDQGGIVVLQASLALSYGYGLGQSFTVGLPGALTQIDFQMGRYDNVGDPLQVELRTALAGGDLPDLSPSALLYSGSINAADVPVLLFTDSFTTSIDLSGANVIVAPGQKLVMLLTTYSGAPYNWDNSGYFYSNPYPGGTSLKQDGGNWIQLEHDWDFGFRTWVAAVPEPSGLLPMGLLVLAIGRRWARKQSNSR